MSPSPLAGKIAPPEMLANIPRLIGDYYTNRPDPAERSGQRSTSAIGDAIAARL